MPRFSVIYLKISYTRHANTRIYSKKNREYLSRNLSFLYPIYHIYIQIFMIICKNMWNMSDFRRETASFISVAICNFGSQ